MSEEKIRIDTHGEDYGNWMSSPVFYMLGALLVISVVLMVMSFTLVRMAIQNFSKNPVISMVSGLVG